MESPTAPIHCKAAHWNASIRGLTHTDMGEVPADATKTTAADKGSAHSVMNDRKYLVHLVAATAAAASSHSYPATVSTLSGICLSSCKCVNTPPNSGAS